MRITLLGTGTPTPLIKRAGSGYLVETESECFVFDCGPGSYRRFLEMGKEPTQITQLFVTHWHYDHCTDLPHYVLQRWDQGAGKIPELNIYGPRPIRRIAKALFEKDGVFDSDLEARTRNEMSAAIYHARGGTGPRERPRPLIAEAEHGSEFRGDDWRVRAIEVPHVQPYLRCLAYRLESEGRSLVYSGDSGPTDRMTSLCEGADVLMHMCHYLNGTELSEAMARGCGSPRMIGALARDAGVKIVVLTHFTGQIDGPGVREQVISEVHEVFQGTVIFGEDMIVVSPESMGRAGMLLCLAFLNGERGNDQRGTVQAAIGSSRTATSAPGTPHSAKLRVRGMGAPERPTMRSSPRWRWRSSSIAVSLRFKPQSNTSR